MFTWIIEKKAKILKADKWDFELENLFEESLQIWQSIAHDWACMTVSELKKDSYKFFVMQESLSKTNFSLKKSGDYFNVERCLKIWDRLDWHFVTGHIDFVWEVLAVIENSDSSWQINIKYPQEYYKNIVQKGSVCVNWTSLTIMLDEPWKFAVSIIPITQEITNLWGLKKWDKVNIELDMVWKYILKNN